MAENTQELNILLRPMKESDADAVARLHREEIHTAFLSTLGKRFLKNLYQGLVRSGEAILVVADKDNEVVGFVAATMGLDALYRKVLWSRWWRFLLILLGKLFSPRVIKHCWETLRHPSRQAQDGLPEAEILSIAVDRQVTGRGVGRLLINRALDELWARGASGVRVVCLKALETANVFYPKVGFRLVQEIKIHGRPTKVYTINRPGTAC